MAHALDRDRIRRFYDRLGRRLDSQGAYEDPAFAWLRREGAFETARTVFELGCGTGRLVADLLAKRLPSEATYRGVDLSPKMVALATERLAPWAPRATVQQVDGTLPWDLASAAVDRVLATYVLDLLPDPEIDAVLVEARRVLAPGGRLCLASITPGCGALSRAVMGLWSALARRRPMWLGGCRPIRLAERLAPDAWTIRAREVVVRLGIATECLVAAPAFQVPPGVAGSGA